MIDADSDYIPHTEDKALIAEARAYLERQLVVAPQESGT